MEQLLNKIPEMRLGGSMNALKSHQFFSDFDWEKLIEGKLKKPFIPPSEKFLKEEEIVSKEKVGKRVIE